MNRHAKAPLSGSTTRQSTRLGAFLRGALARRAVSPRTDGRGAPATRALLPALLATFAAALLLLAPAALAQRGTVQIIDAEVPVEGLAVNDASGDLYAATTHGVKVYDSSGAFQFEFGDPIGIAGGHDIAIDQTSGDVYVLEGDANRVAKYDPAGNLLFYFGWNVNQTQNGSAPEICPRAGFPGDTCQAGERRTDPGALGYPASSPNVCHPSAPAQGIAVGPDGRIYVSEPGRQNGCDEQPSQGNRRIQIFTPSGALASAFLQPFDPVGCSADPRLAYYEPNACNSNLEPYQIALDSQGTIYTTPSPVGGIPGTGFEGFEFPGCSDASEFRTCSIRRFSESGTPLSDFATSHTFGRLVNIAIDHSNDHVYVYQASNSSEQQYEVAVYDREGNQLEELARGLPVPDGNFQPPGPVGLAVRDGSSRVYVADLSVDPVQPTIHSTRIFVLDNLSSVPQATIDPVTVKGSESATFTGTVNPNSSEFTAGYHFEYRADGNPNWTPASSSDASLSAGTSDVPVSQDVANLDPNTTYHVRLVISRELGAGSAHSSEVTFTTDAEPPAVSLVGASRVTDTSARLGALIDPRHAATTYYFKYGTDTSYGSSVPAAQDGDAGGGLAVPAFQRVGDLTPNTTYHYCLFAESAIGGQAPCEDHTFTTTTSAAQNWPQRGLELVNEPDKGNQDVVSPFLSWFSGYPFMTADGSRVVWLTAGGTPDSSGGTFPFFVSHRTSSGWVSEPFTPTPDQMPQDGHPGEYTYQYLTANPSLTTFLIIASSQNQTFGGVPSHLIRASSPADQVDLAFNVGFPDFYRAALASLDLSRVVEEPGQAILSSLTSYEAGPDTAVSAPACGASISRPPGSNPPVTPTDVFFESAGDTNCGAPPELYVADFATNTLTLISGPAIGPQKGATLLGVKEDGSGAMFMTRSALLPQDTDTDNDIYLWSKASGDLQCLTCAIAGFAPEGEARASTDLSRVYYNDADGAWVLEVGSGETRPVAPEGIKFFERSSFPNSIKMTPDGSALAFVTANRLTASAPGANSRQVYLYRDATRSLECISCQDSGGPTDSVDPVDVDPARDNLGLSADGSTVAFRTPAALTPRDINNRIDVYEWHNGVVRLVTDGVHEWPGSFATPRVWGISSDGKTLFISAGGSHLTGTEHDSYVNLYDAQVGGGFPVPTPPAHCSEDACQGPLLAAPPLDAQGSSTFKGPGNPTVTKARKGPIHHHRRRSHKRRRSAPHAPRSSNRSHG